MFICKKIAAPKHVSRKQHIVARRASCPKSFYDQHGQYLPFPLRSTCSPILSSKELRVPGAIVCSGLEQLGIQTREAQVLVHVIETIDNGALNTSGVTKKTNASNRLQCNALLGIPLITAHLQQAIVMILLVLVVVLFVAFLLQRLAYKKLLHQTRPAQNFDISKYANLLEDSGYVAAVVGLDGLVQYVSKNVEQLIGIPREHYEGRPSTLLLPNPELWNTPNNPFKQRQDIKIKMPDGTSRWISYRFFPIRIENGQIESWHVILWNNDLEKSAEEKLKAIAQQRLLQHRLTQDIIDNIPSAVYIKDLEGRYLVVNKKLCDIFDKTPEELLEQRDADLFPEKSSQNFRYANEQVIIHKSLVTYEDVVVRNGKKQIFWVVKFPLLNTAGMVQNICGLATDITERKENEINLLNATRAADQARIAQETFLANMSHEIRTPLNGIMGMSQLLLTADQSEEQRAYTQTILESARHLLAIINDVLDFSKIRSGKFHLEKVFFQPEILLKKTIIPLRFKADEKMLALTINVAEQVPQSLEGDPLRLQQIIINLVSNAIKFTAHGGVRITMGGRYLEPNLFLLQVSVADTGIGIAKSKQQLIFESFTQNSAQTSRKYGGSGLGLTIVKQLTKLQNGKVALKSNIGEGATFSIEIPYNAQKPASDEHQREHTIGAQNDQLLAGIKLLIAEDNLVNQKVVLHLLNRQGAQTTVVANGNIALKMLAEDSFDAILMDLQMPELDGYTTTKIIRNDLRSNIPIIAMTADALKGEAEKCFKCGMNGYISKPFEPNDLYQEIIKYTREPATYTHKKSENMQEQTLVDLSYLYDLAGNDQAYLVEVINLFLGTMPDGLKNLGQLIRGEKEKVVIQQQAHQLKSSVSIVRIRKMYEDLSQMEQLAKEDASYADMMPILIEMEERFAAARPIIENARLGGGNKREYVVKE